MNPDFSNTEKAFMHLSDRELKRAVFLFSFITKPFWVKTGKILISVARFLHIPYGWAVRKNVFAHFCGGETMEKCIPAIHKLVLNNCFSILDYSAEGLQGEKNFDDVCKEIIATIEMSKANKNIAFGVFKFTGMADFSVLEKVSANEALTNEEQMYWNNALQRVRNIFEAGSNTGLPVFVDAEETWIQPAIDSMIENMMLKFNRESAVAFTTVQMYRTDGVQKVQQLIEHAKTHGYVSGVKLVRGAYMEKERERAAKHGYQSPIHPSKPETDKAFNDAVALCIENIEHIYLCIATHNELSCSLAVDQMQNSNIAPEDRRIWFAQLFGMSDHITFNLAGSDYRTAKYLPYGPVQKVMPYLIRRAEENSSMGDQSNREIENYRKEIARRKSIQ
jgi:proline dehydrogenase